jgi:uracil-DNA glycosylase
MDSQQIDFLQSVHSLLLYHHSIGIECYPAGEAAARFLREAVTVTAPTVASKQRETRVGTAPVAESFRELTTGTCDNIAEEVRSCTSCNLHLKRLLPVPGHGSEHPKVLFVGGWLIGEEETKIPTERVFGLEEDVMVSRMLSAIMLPPEKAFITNIIKCAVPLTCQPTAENVHICLSFLQRQIMVLAPEIICTMGIIATKALLKNSQPLSQLRGKFHQFAVSDAKSIPVIPTYHPTFLLQNPELKRATWEDLQNIARQLKTIGS